jgi:hypothetical protein
MGNPAFGRKVAITKKNLTKLPDEFADGGRIVLVDLSCYYHNIISSHQDGKHFHDVYSTFLTKEQLRPYAIKMVRLLHSIWKRYETGFFTNWCALKRCVC